MIKPLQLINSLRKTDGYIEAIFTGGGCYQFHLFLKNIYPKSEPFINKNLDHIISKLGNRFYDITGEVKNVKSFRPVSKSDLPIIKKWSFRNNCVLKITECPACEEPICV